MRYSCGQDHEPPRHFTKGKRMKPSNLALSRTIGLAVCFTLLAAAPTEARAQAKEDDDSVIYHGALFIPKKGVRFDQAAADALKAKFPDLAVFIDPPKED